MKQRIEIVVLMPQVDYLDDEGKVLGRQNGKTIMVGSARFGSTVQEILDEALKESEEG